jgi:glutathione S-transferase
VTADRKLSEDAREGDPSEWSSRALTRRLADYLVNAYTDGRGYDPADLDDVEVTQSDAITRYAVKLAGLYPADPLQALFCDEIMAALEDVIMKLGATFRLQGDDLKAARLALVDELFPKYLRWLEGQLEKHGGEFLADGRLTVADLKALTLLRWISSGMLDHIPIDILEKFAPKLRPYVDRIAALPQISQYYAGRR